MSRTLTIAGAVALAAATAHAQLDVRHLYLTNDVTHARSAVAPLRWYQGESLKVDLYARRGTAAVNLTNATSVRMETFLATNLTVAYMMETGTIANATNGYVTFDIEPGRANVPAASYKTYVKAYQLDGGEYRYVGTLLAADAQVFWGPSATNYVYQGPYGSATGYITSVAYGGQSGTGAVTTVNGAVTVVFPAGGGGGTVASVSASTGLVEIGTATDPILALSGASVASLAKADSAIQTELDPVWGAVSNTVTAGAALGATALQAEADMLQDVVNRGGNATNVGVLTFAAGPTGQVKLGPVNGISMYVDGSGNLTWSRYAGASASSVMMVQNADGAAEWQGASWVAPNLVYTNRTLTINGVAYTLEADRSWTIGSVDYASVANLASNVTEAVTNAIVAKATNEVAGVGYLLPASTQSLATVSYVDTATNNAVIDATNRVAGVGYLLPASTQDLATVSYVNTATNNAVIDATNRVAGVGYLLPASTQSLATVSYVDTATNNAVIDATNRVAGVGYLLPASTNNVITNIVAGANVTIVSTGQTYYVSSTGGGTPTGRQTNVLFSAYTSTNLPLTQNAWTAIKYDREDFDAGDYHANGIFTSKEDGWYSFSVRSASSGGSMVGGVGMFINGTNKIASGGSTFGYTIDSVDPWPTFSDVVYMSSGHVAQIYIIQNTSGRSLASNKIYTGFSMWKE